MICDIISMDGTLYKVLYSCGVVEWDNTKRARRCAAATLVDVYIKHRMSED